MRFDFEALEGSESDEIDETEERESVLQLPDPTSGQDQYDDEILTAAYEAEDSDDLHTAIDCYHAVLTRDTVDRFSRLNGVVGVRICLCADCC